MSNSEACKSQCMTIAPSDSQSVVPPTNSVAGGQGGFSPLWLLSGLPVVGVGGILLSGGGTETAGPSSPITPGPAVPLGDIALLPSAVVTIFVMILLKKRMSAS